MFVRPLGSFPGIKNEKKKMEEKERQKNLKMPWHVICAINMPFCHMANRNFFQQKCIMRLGRDCQSLAVGEAVCGERAGCC